MIHSALLVIFVDILTCYVGTYMQIWWIGITSFSIEIESLPFGRVKDEFDKVRHWLTCISAKHHACKSFCISIIPKATRQGHQKGKA